MAAQFARALALARAEATKMRTDAGFGGRHDDGGAGALEALCSAFECGMNGKAPEFLKPYAAEASRQADPEYATFQRLRAKFGDAP